MGNGELEFWSSGGMETLVQRAEFPRRQNLQREKGSATFQLHHPASCRRHVALPTILFEDHFGRVPKRARKDSCAPLFTQNGTRILKSTPPLPNTPLLPKQLLGRRAGRLLGVHDPLVSGGTHFNGGIVTA